MAATVKSDVYIKTFFLVNMKRMVAVLSEYEMHGSCSPKLFSKNKKRSYMRKQDTLARQRLVNAIIINAT